ncbi:MAG TPA: Fe-S cluster assembly protein SufB, partial [Ottowia sp.]|nr:Fe-S cluster assembly protein SufB [Ottowia sp.]
MAALPEASGLPIASEEKTQAPALTQALARPYQHGFVTDVESDSLPPGLDEDTIRAISRIKKEPEFLLKWRLAALERFFKMEEPDWAYLRMQRIDLQSLSYYSAPKSMQNAPKSLDEVDPKLLETYEKLGVPLHERARLAGVAVDAGYDSGSGGNTFRK